MSTESLSTVDARNQFAEVINRAAYGHERVVLTRRGREVVAVVPIEDLRTLQALEDRLDVDAALEAMREVESAGTTSWEALKQEAGV